MKYLLGADIGTTSLKATVFDETGKPVRSASRDYTLIVSGSRVEFPAEEYVRLFAEAYEEVTNGLEITALSIDTQCETMILTDENGQPLYNAVVWLDNRAADQAEQIKAHFGNRKVYEVTGQPEITATWPAAKLLWFRQNLPRLFSRVRKIFLLEDWLLFRLTGRFVTEKTLQSSTIYFNIKDECWWPDMLRFVGIDEGMLPELHGSGERIGEYRGAQVCTSAMDQIAGAIGAGVTDQSIISETTGTTLAVFMACDEVPIYDPASIVPCHKNFDGGYCLLSWTPTAGMALKWFRNNLCEDFSFRELDNLAGEAPAGSAGLVFLPYLCGSTMPRYAPNAKGAFLGLTMEHTRAHFVRSILEAVACMLKENLDYLHCSCEEIRALGGGANSPLWCQIKADMTGRRVAVLKNKETACLGSAILAGTACGVFSDVRSVCSSLVQVEKVFMPSGVDYTECYRIFLEGGGKLL